MSDTEPCTAYPPHKLILALLYAGTWELDGVCLAVEGRFGALDSSSRQMSFIHTHYYDAEMGTPIHRALVSVRELVDPASLAALKREANRLETMHRRPDGGRTINVDPGLLSLSRVILATTKQSAHRVAIGLGVYAEVTLLYRKGRFHPFEWTYPDFRSGIYDSWLAEVRHGYHEQLKAIDPGRSWRL